MSSSSNSTTSDEPTSQLERPTHHPTIRVSSSKHPKTVRRSWERLDPLSFKSPLISFSSVQDVTQLASSRPPIANGKAAYRDLSTLGNMLGVRGTLTIGEDGFYKLGTKTSYIYNILKEAKLESDTIHGIITSLPAENGFVRYLSSKAESSFREAMNRETKRFLAKSQAPGVATEGSERMARSGDTESSEKKLSKIEDAWTAYLSHFYQKVFDGLDSARASRDAARGLKVRPLTSDGFDKSLTRTELEDADFVKGYAINPDKKDGIDTAIQDVQSHYSELSKLEDSLDTTFVHRSCRSALLVNVCHGQRPHPLANDPVRDINLEGLPAATMGKMADPSLVFTFMVPYTKVDMAFCRGDIKNLTNEPLNEAERWLSDLSHAKDDFSSKKFQDPIGEFASEFDEAQIDDFSMEKGSQFRSLCTDHGKRLTEFIKTAMKEKFPDMDEETLPLIFHVSPQKMGSVGKQSTISIKERKSRKSKKTSEGIEASSAGGE